MNSAIKMALASNESGPARKFWANARIIGASEDDCWEWAGPINNYGYGRFHVNGKRMQAHRAAYILKFGSIPVGLVNDHLCRNRKCVNPSHLEPVTNVVNVMRGQSPYAQKKRQTHCIRGHLLAGANLKVRKNGTRFCRACDRDRARINYAARKNDQRIAIFR